MSNNQVIIRRRADVLPGYVLSAPPFLAMDELVDVMERVMLERVIGVQLARAVPSFQIIDDAPRNISTGNYFPVYSRAFLRAIFNDRRFTPSLLRVCLMRDHPTATLAQCRELLAGSEPGFHRLRSVCLDLFDVGPVGRRRGQAQSDGKGGIDLNGFTLALMKRGIAWSDIQTMTLSQALLILVGDRSEQQRVEELRIDKQIAWLDRLVKKHGRSLKDLGRLGAVKVKAFIAETTGKDVSLDAIHTLLEEPEFTP